MSLEKGWWRVVWKAGFRDSSPEKQAIHPNKVSFRESSLENGMLPHLRSVFMTRVLKSSDLGPGWMVFMTRVLKRSGGGWFGGLVLVTPVPKNRPSTLRRASFRESSLENGMLPHLGRCFHDSSPEKLGSWTWGWMVFMTWRWVVWRAGFRDSSPEKTGHPP